MGKPSFLCQYLRLRDLHQCLISSHLLVPFCLFPHFFPFPPTHTLMHTFMTLSREIWARFWNRRARKGNWGCWLCWRCNRRQIGTGFVDPARRLQAEGATVQKCSAIVRNMGQEGPRTFWCTLPRTRTLLIPHFCALPVTSTVSDLFSTGREIEACTGILWSQESPPAGLETEHDSDVTVFTRDSHGTCT